MGGVWATVGGVIVGLAPRILRARRWLVGAAAVVAMGLAAAPASARDPVIAYLNASRQLQLYDSEAGAAVSAPALGVKNTQNAFAVSFDGRYIAYIAASDGAIHLFDRVANAAMPLPFRSNHHRAPVERWTRQHRRGLRASIRCV